MLEVVLEVGRVHDEADRLAPLHQDERDDDECHQDEGEQDDDEQGSEGAPLVDVHLLLSEVHSVPQSFKREVKLVK